MGMGDIKKYQERVWQNKIDHGFDLDKPDREFCLLYGEVGEAYEAYLKGFDTLDEELADVAIYLMGLSQMLGVDLESAVLKKMTKNEKRVYKKVGKAFIKTEK